MSAALTAVSVNTPNTVLVLSRWPENSVIVGKGVVVATEAVM